MSVSGSGGAFLSSFFCRLFFSFFLFSLFFCPSQPDSLFNFFLCVFFLFFSLGVAKVYVMN